MLTLTSWRLPHWLILGGIVLFLAAYAGVFPDLHNAVAWFSNRPEVADAFNDPNFGRADALILVFSTLFLGPLAILFAVILTIFLLAVLGGVALPLVRWFSLPDWTATALVILTLAVVAYVESHVWLPRSLWFIGLLARACLIVLT